MAASEHRPIPTSRMGGESVLCVLCGAPLLRTYRPDTSVAAGWEHVSVSAVEAIDGVARALFDALHTASAAESGWISEDEYVPGRTIGLDLADLDLRPVALRVLEEVQRRLAAEVRAVLQEKDGVAIAAPETNEGN